VRTERLAYLDALMGALGLAGVVGRGFTPEPRDARETTTEGEPGTEPQSNLDFYGSLR
jgi:hypothetical protein